MSSFYSSLLKFFTGNVLLTGVNVVRDMSIAAAFGAALSADKFFLAATLLIYLVTVASGATRSVHVPVLQRFVSRGDDSYKPIARRIVALNVRAVLGCLLAFALLAYLGIQLGALSHDTSLAEKARMLLYTLPMYALSGFVEICQGTLQTRNRILAPSLMRLGLPLGIVAGALVGASSLGINALPVGGLVGSALAAGGIAYLLWKEGLWAISAPKLPDDVGKVVRAGLLALTISSSIAYINPVVDLWLAQLLGAGAVSKLGYASRLTVGVASLLVGSFSPVFLHQFSRFVATDNRAALRSVYSHFLAFAPWLGACMTVGTWLVSGIVAPLLYQRGHFAASDAQAVVSVIDAYALQFPFFLTCTVGFTLISALAKTHVFIRLNTILLVSNLVADVALMHYFGLQGLALSTAVVYAISVLSLNTYLWHEGTVRPDAHSINGALLALGSMGAALVVVSYFDLKLTPASGPASYVTGALVLAVLIGIGSVFNWQRIVSYRVARRSA